MKLSDSQKEKLLYFVYECIVKIRAINYQNDDTSKMKIEMLCNIIHNIPLYINRDDFNFVHLYHGAEMLSLIFKADYFAKIRDIENDNSPVV